MLALELLLVCLAALHYQTLLFLCVELTELKGEGSEFTLKIAASNMTASVNGTELTGADLSAAQGSGLRVAADAEVIVTDGGANVLGTTWYTDILGTKDKTTARTFKMTGDVDLSSLTAAPKLYKVTLASDAFEGGATVVGTGGNLVLSAKLCSDAAGTSNVNELYLPATSGKAYVKFSVTPASGATAATDIKLECQVTATNAASGKYPNSSATKIITSGGDEIDATMDIDTITVGGTPAVADITISYAVG